MKSASIAVLAAVAIGVAAATPATAFTAFTSSKILNLRGGPGEEFPIVGVMQRGVRVDVTGCIEDYTWCLVTVDGLVGWSFAQSMVVDTEEGIIHIQEAAATGMVPVVGADGVLVVRE